jgi:NADPH:quinone reductase-like Zn-dependent oxidoreductase
VAFGDGASHFPAPHEHACPPTVSHSWPAEAAAGRLRPVIGQRFPLACAANAHAALVA